MKVTIRKDSRKNPRGKHESDEQENGKNDDHVVSLKGL